MQIKTFQVEFQNHPVGLDVLHPRFFWKLLSAQQNVRQTAFHLTVQTGGSTVWDSGRQEREDSVYIAYAGHPLQPCTVYEASVTVWDNHGQEASAQTTFETGLLHGSAFCAGWITHALPKEETASPVFVKTFAVKKPVRSARLYATALGIYEACLNGGRVGNRYFAPGWTNYKTRLQYQTYPIENLQVGENVLSFTVGNGWYKGALGFMPEPNRYGDRTALLAELHIWYEDGSEDVLPTDASWQVGTGPIRSSEFYFGEVYDSTVQPSGFAAAVPADFGTAQITAQEDEPVRIQKRLSAVQCFVTPKGERVLDFGQNIAGFVEWKYKGEKGQKVKLRHAEALDENGNFYTGNLSFATAEDVYVCDGTAQTFCPHFTYHGFRYIRVEGLEDLHPEDFTACAISADLEETGSFSCSDSRINQLQSNIQWSQRDNFVDIPTDCPQRSERLGWTGDVRAFCGTAVFNSQADLFFTKWLRDLASEQTPEKGVPQVVPDVMQQPGTAFWGDVATVLPWKLYTAYGDKRVLEGQYASMKGWVDYMTAHSGENGLWQDGYQYGDWLALDAEQAGLTDERNGATDRYMIANACYADSVDILAKTAEVLQKEQDAKAYRKLYQTILDAFCREYITETGRLVSETQTACVIVLYFHLAAEKDRAHIVQTLVSNLNAHHNHMTTGFVGTPFICHVLSENGQHELAGKIVRSEDCPSWLYEVKMGATTVWERWNSILPDGSFNPKNMNSLNHYAYGSIGDWLYRKLAGINELQPGYRSFEIRPQMVKGICSVRASLETVYGTIRSAWSCKNHQITVEVEIPVNTTAQLYLPEREMVTLGSGKYRYAYATETELETERYSMETPLHVVLNHPAAVSILKKAAPEMLTNPMLEYVKDSPLSEMLAYSAQAKPLFEQLI